MSETCSTCRWLWKFSKYTAIFTMISVSVISVIFALCWLAAEIALWGYAPPFPWFLWRFFAVLACGFSGISAVIATMIEPSHQLKEGAHG